MTQHRVLFVCTGNIFRSMVAEHAIRSAAAAVDNDACWIFESAGTEAKPQNVHDAVQEELSVIGYDVSSHRQRRVTQEMLDRASVVIAMSTDHRDYLRAGFNRKSYLFWEVATGESKAFLDVDEAIPDYKTNKDAAYDYARQAVKQIVAHAGEVYKNLPLFLHKE